MKLGARIFKTGLAITLSLYISLFLGLTPPMFSALAATFAIQPSIYRSFQTIVEQIQANVIGAVLAVIFVLTFGHQPFVVGVVSILAIAIILKLKLESSTIPLAIATVIIIMETPAENFIEFASIRFLLILIGVFSAFIVNLLFLPPRYETKLYTKIVQSTEQITQLITLVIRKDVKRHTLMKDITHLNEKVVQLDNLYLLYKEERNYFLKNHYSKARKVVLFRQMIVTSKKALGILKELERRENELSLLPEAIQEQIKNHLSQLIEYHHRIFLRYAGKVHTPPHDEWHDDLQSAKCKLTEQYMGLYQAEQGPNEEWMHLLPFISTMIEYQEQMLHMAHLMESFFSYHQSDNKVNLNVSEDE